ncbi:uncharacterized protein LOC133518485 [Cydia pomonella]|uniref:uncharacterized protein LOC133518485 n=1 Tax=Cydia pomonella TaxID=82600 RepID=UPI002ADE456C|nr:uncharacterized protein LOC133518485 [Cydia pomonella]
MSYTILDYLNEDCWRAVLQYVPLRDIMRTESASKRWQTVMLTYLQGARISILNYDDIDDDMLYDKNLPYNCNVKLVRSGKYCSFNSWTKKLGSSVVAAYSYYPECFKILQENCSNLETLYIYRTLNDYDYEVRPYNLQKNFKRLQNLCIDSCHASDNCVSQLIAGRALTEINFNGCFLMTGECLSTINTTKLKSLVFKCCPDVQSRSLLPHLVRLSQLTKLKVSLIDKEVCRDLRLVLDKMPNLEWLEIMCTGEPWNNYYTNETLLCRLTRLKHLCVDFNLEDYDVDDVTRCCKELRSLKLSQCGILTEDSVEAICRNAGARLTTLSLLQFYKLEDDQLLALIRGCPQLTSLAVGTLALTLDVIKRAAEARHKVRPGLLLELDLAATNLPEDLEYYENIVDIEGQIETKYEDLIVLLDDSDRNF